MTNQRAQRRQRLSPSYLFFCWFLLLSCGGSTGTGSIQPLLLTTSAGDFSFSAELADTAALRERGLMNRSDLTDDSAMLFVWPTDTQGSFWMKDTPTSLDIIFISSQFSVNYIATDTVPFSTDLITPLSPYRYVLEVKAGFVERSGLQLGDTLQLR